MEVNFLETQLGEHHEWGANINGEIKGWEANFRREVDAGQTPLIPRDKGG